MGTPRALAKAGSLSALGKACPRSHFNTATEDTPSNLARSRWESAAFMRACRMFNRAIINASFQIFLANLWLSWYNELTCNYLPCSGCRKTGFPLLRWPSANLWLIAYRIN